MCCAGLIKRFVPFFISLTLGLFIASFFVTVSSPNFSRPRFKKHRDCYFRQESELQRLRQENSRLKEELRQLEIKNQYGYSRERENEKYPLFSDRDNFDPRIANEFSTEPRKTK